MEGVFHAIQSLLIPMQRVSLQAPGALILLLALGWISSGRVHAATYTLLDLGTFSDQAGRTESQPAGINNLGAVVASNLRSGNYRALDRKSTRLNSSH